jgi:3-deoxy-D-manno-octulosonate 8-phosphate phosphatase (KDO 8-P phosphatase)
MGVSLARRAGIQFALISGEDSPLVDRYASKMHIGHVFKGRREKAVALREFAASISIELANICYIGDDINDLPAMQIAGFSACPANAVRDVLKEVQFVSGYPGGSGAVREVVDAILTARNLNSLDVFSRS